MWRSKTVAAVAGWVKDRQLIHHHGRSADAAPAEALRRGRALGTDILIAKALCTTCSEIQSMLAGFLFRLRRTARGKASGMDQPPCCSSVAREDQCSRPYVSSMIRG